jgi:hypothetical protein
LRRKITPATFKTITGPATGPVSVARAINDKRNKTAQVLFSHSGNAACLVSGGNTANHNNYPILNQRNIPARIKNLHGTDLSSLPRYKFNFYVAVRFVYNSIHTFLVPLDGLEATLTDSPKQRGQYDQNQGRQPSR